MKWIWLVFVLVSLNALAAEATLEIVADKERLTFSQSQLLSRGDLQTISLADSAYQEKFTRFKAIPITNLFKGLAIPDLAAQSDAWILRGSDSGCRTFGSDRLP